MECFLLYVVAGLCLHLTFADRPTVLITDSETVVEGGAVTLQCLTEFSDLSAYKFQIYSKWRRGWFDVDTDTRFRCWYYQFNVSRDNDQLFLRIKNIYRWHKGPYRCVSNSSQSDNITIPIHYLDGISISDQNRPLSRYLPDPRFISVSPGSNIHLECSVSSSETAVYQWSKEGSDWIYPNQELQIESVTEVDSGNYSCQAKHPTVSGLLKTRSVLIRVVKESPPVAFSEVNLVTAVAVPVGILLVIVLALIAFGCRWTLRTDSKKQPLDDEAVNKTPIWKGSQTSVPSTAGDNIPLVI
uniref:Ig-like domain-containing protein n=1 Tax=Callorhinchus milii TaxID=7868 RepID=V9L6R0_CALMI